MNTLWTIGGQEGTLTVVEDPIGYKHIRWESSTITFNAFFMRDGAETWSVWEDNEFALRAAVSFGKVYVHPEFVALAYLMR